MEETTLKEYGELAGPGRQVWHKPLVQELTVSLDTASVDKAGSAADGGTFDRGIGGGPD